MKKLTVIILFCAVLLSSCTHYYYVANVQNVPLFRDKNEFQLSGAYGGGDQTTCIEVQSAYSITGNVAVMANFMSAKGGDITSNNYGKGSYFEGAVGYFKPVNKYGVFQIFGGIGRCSQHHEYGAYYYNTSTGVSEGSNGYSDVAFAEFFVQPSAGISLNALDVAFSTRICDLYYGNITNQALGNARDYNTLFSLDKTNRLNLLPAITLRAGWKYLKLQFQAEYSGFLNNTDMYFGEDWHFSLGLNLMLAKRYK